MKSLKKIILAIISLVLFTTSSRQTYAIVDPLNAVNNPFGIHILDENDLEDAAKLVNSSGGDWGYVTLVIRKDERNPKRWQEVFDRMRNLHLIPIVRIATRQMDDGWEKPNLDEIDGWVAFLSQLNWVIKNRYVVIGNEPNHSKEWGGEIDPVGYAKYLSTFSEKLKKSSADYFMLPAGFDASAPTGRKTLREDVYLKKMLEENPHIFESIDGWTSHSYPNPDFSGSQDAEGRGSVKTFEWELKYLKELGVTKKLPVFITETGWTHTKEVTEGTNNTTRVGEKLKASYELAWNDERVVAVTPFILNYQDPPFDIFSWKKKDGNFYDFYYEVQNLPKNMGKPVQVISVDILSIIFPPLIPENGYMTGVVVVKNSGQNIWEGNDKIYASNRGMEVVIEPKVLFSKVEPGQKTPAVIKVRLPKIVQS